MVRPQPLADGGELPVGEFEQACRQCEPSIQIGRMFGGNRTLVADVVLELRPRVLQHGADLDRRRLLLAFHADQQVPAGVTPPALARRLQAHVAVVEQPHLVGEQRGDRVDVLAQIGDDPQPDLVGDLASGSLNSRCPSTARSALAANDSTLLVRAVTLR